MSESFHAPEYWDGLYRESDTPWEVSQVPRQLTRWIEAHSSGGGSVLIPGCGSGRELAAFAAAGWNVTGIDFAATAIVRARAGVDGADVELILADFFTHPFAAGAFDLIYERTFLTALGPERWPACAARYRELLKPGGRIVGYCYYGYTPDGPPFFQAPDRPPVFARAFVLEEDVVSEDALPFFGERERWQVWQAR